MGTTRIVRSGTWFRAVCEEHRNCGRHELYENYSSAERVARRHISLYHKAGGLDTGAFSVIQEFEW